MDANVYKARLKELKKAFANVDRRIKLFGPEDVTLEDYLEETRKLLVIEAQDVTKNNDCEKQLDDLTISKKTIEQDAIGIHDNEHVKNTFEAELHDAIDMGINESTVEIKLDNDAKKLTVKSIALILIAAQKFKKLLIK